MSLSKRMSSSLTRAQMSTKPYDMAHSLQTEMRDPAMSVDYTKGKEGCKVLVPTPPGLEEVKLAFWNRKDKSYQTWTS